MSKEDASTEALNRQQFLENYEVMRDSVVILEKLCDSGKLKRSAVIQHLRLNQAQYECLRDNESAEQWTAAPLTRLQIALIKCIETLVAFRDIKHDIRQLRSAGQMTRKASKGELQEAQMRHAAKVCYHFRRKLKLSQTEFGDRMRVSGFSINTTEKALRENTPLKITGTLALKLSIENLKLAFPQYSAAIEELSDNAEQLDGDELIDSVHWLEKDVDREVRNESHDVDPEKSPVKDRVKSPKVPDIEERLENALARLDRLELACQRLEGIISTMSAKE